MGAVYNRQNARAIVHFLTTMGLFRLSSIGGMAGFFALAGFTFYIYTIVDAYRTADLIGRGEDPAALDERFRRSLFKRAPLIGLLLVLTGLILFIELVHPFALGISLLKLAPVGLILLGGYLIISYLKRSNNSSADYTPKPSSVVYFSRSGEHGSVERRRYAGDRSDFMR